MAVAKAYKILWSTGLVFAILSHLNLGLLSDYKICGDSECQSLMSRVQAIRDHHGKDCRFLNFKRRDIIFVYHKLTGKRDDLWAGSIDKQFGYFPKDAVQEEQVHATIEKVVETQESDFFCMDENGYFIDSSHLDDDADDDHEKIQNQESEITQTTQYTDDTKSESPSKPEDVSTERPVLSHEADGISTEEDENKIAHDAAAGTHEEAQETSVAANEQGGSASSAWLGSSVTGWLGLATEEVPAEGVREDERKETEAEASSFTSSVTGWLGFGGEGKPDDAVKSTEEDHRQSEDSFTSTMTGWLGFGGEKKNDDSTEKEQDEERENEKEQEPAEKFRSRRMSLDLEGSQLHEEEKEEMGTLDWLGNGLSNTLGFGLTNQESEHERTTEGEAEETIQEEEEQPPSSSWFDAGVRDILGFRRDKSEDDEKTGSDLKGAEEDKTLEGLTGSENVDTSLSQPVLTEEVRTETSDELKMEETPKDQNVSAETETETLTGTTETVSEETDVNSLDSLGMIGKNTEAETHQGEVGQEGEGHSVKDSSPEFGSSHNTDVVSENATEEDKKAFSTESTAQMEDNPDQDHTQNDSDAHMLKETVKETEKDENNLKPFQTETIELEKYILNESGLRSSTGSETVSDEREEKQGGIDEEEVKARQEQQEIEEEKQELKEEEKQEKTEELEKEKKQEVEEETKEKENQGEEEELKEEEEVKALEKQQEMEEEKQNEAEELKEEEKQEEIKELEKEEKQEEEEETKEKENQGEEEELKEEKEVKALEKQQEMEEEKQDEADELKEEEKQEEIEEFKEEEKQEVEEETKEEKNQGEEEELKEEEEVKTLEKQQEMEVEKQEKVEELKEEEKQEEIEEFKEEEKQEVEEETKEEKNQGEEEELKEEEEVKALEKQQEVEEEKQNEAEELQEDEKQEERQKLEKEEKQEEEEETKEKENQGEEEELKGQEEVKALEKQQEVEVEKQDKEGELKEEEKQEEIEEFKKEEKQEVEEETKEEKNQGEEEERLEEVKGLKEDEEQQQIEELKEETQENVKELTEDQRGEDLKEVEEVNEKDKKVSEEKQPQLSHFEVETENTEGPESESNDKETQGEISSDSVLSETSTQTEKRETQNPQIEEETTEEENKKTEEVEEEKDELKKEEVEEKQEMENEEDDRRDQEEEGDLKCLNGLCHQASEDGFVGDRDGNDSANRLSSIDEGEETGKQNPMADNDQILAVRTGVSQTVPSESTERDEDRKQEEEQRNNDLDAGEGEKKTSESSLTRNEEVKSNNANSISDPDALEVNQIKNSDCKDNDQLCSGESGQNSLHDHITLGQTAENKEDDQLYSSEAKNVNLSDDNMLRQEDKTKPEYTETSGQKTEQIHSDQKIDTKEDTDREEGQMNGKHDDVNEDADMQMKINDGSTVGTEGGIEISVSSSDPEKSQVVTSEQDAQHVSQHASGSSLPSDGHSKGITKTEGGGAFGLLKNAFRFFSETPATESTESAPSLDSNAGETSEAQESLTPEQQLDLTADSTQVHIQDLHTDSPITLSQQQQQPSPSPSIQTSSPSPTQNLFPPSSQSPNTGSSHQTKTLSKHYKNLLTYMSVDEMTILIELFGRHKLQFLDYILGSSDSMTDDPDNDESILSDIERLLHYHKETLAAPSLRFADAPQKDKEKTRTLIALQNFELLLAKVRETFNTGKSDISNTIHQAKAYKDKEIATKEESSKVGHSSVGLDNNNPRDQWMGGHLNGGTGKEGVNKGKTRGEEEKRVSPESRLHVQAGPSQTLEGVLKQILDSVHQMAEYSTTHIHEAKELLMLLKVQVRVICRFKSMHDKHRLNYLRIRAISVICLIL